MTKKQFTNRMVAISLIVLIGANIFIFGILFAIPGTIIEIIVAYGIFSGIDKLEKKLVK